MNSTFGLALDLSFLIIIRTLMYSNTSVYGNSQIVRLYLLWRTAKQKFVMTLMPTSSEWFWELLTPSQLREVDWLHSVVSFSDQKAWYTCCIHIYINEMTYCSVHFLSIKGVFKLYLYLPLQLNISTIVLVYRKKTCSKRFLRFLLLLLIYFLCCCELPNNFHLSLKNPLMLP